MAPPVHPLLHKDLPPPQGSQAVPPWFLWAFLPERKLRRWHLVEPTLSLYLISEPHLIYILSLLDHPFSNPLTLRDRLGRF